MADTRTGTSSIFDSFYCHIEACTPQFCSQSFLHNWTRVNSPLLLLQGDLTAENINALKDFFGD